METLGFIFVALDVLAVVFLFRWCYNSIRHKRLIQDVPTSKTSGLFIGLVELKGTAESENPLTGHLSGNPCVWHSWQIEEEWRRTRTVVTPDAKGKIQTRTVTETGWDIVAAGSESQPFYLKDDSGVVLIHPDKAQIEGQNVLSKTCGADDPFYDRFGPDEAVSGSTGRRSFSETSIPLHKELYVMGRSRVREDVVAPELAWDETGPVFLISTKSEEKIIQSRRESAVLSGIFFILFISLGCGITADDSRLGLLSGAGAALLLGTVWFWLVHRSIVELRNRAFQALANIDVELKRRHDLILRLVEVVREMERHERELMIDITRLRTQQSDAESSDAGFSGKLSPMAGVVFGMIERCPELKSNGLFLNLHRNLAETEQRVALARHYYNDLVEHVNNRREMFPDRLVARITGLKKLSYFVAKDFETVPIDVKLCSGE